MGHEVSEKNGSHDRGRVVRRYLSALDARKPGRTTARTAESVAHRMHQIDTLLLSADPVQRLHLTQERIDLHAEVLRLRSASVGDFDELEKAFVRVARSYGDRHDVTYSAWRQVGVDGGVLAQAGIHPQVKPDRRAEPTKAQPGAKADAAATAEPAPKTDAPEIKAEPDAVQDGPKAEAPAPKAPTKKAAAAKKAPDATKGAAAPNGSSTKQQGKKAAAKKAAEPKPEQQQLPAEAHLLS